MRDIKYYEDRIKNLPEGETDLLIQFQQSLIEIMKRVITNLEKEKNEI